MSRLNELITELCPDGVEYKKVSEIAAVSRGKVMSKDYLQEHSGSYPVYSSQTENDGQFGTIDTYMFDGEYLTWTTDGANAGTVFYRNGKFSVTNVCGVINIKPKTLDVKFAYYYLNKEAPKHVNSGMGNPKLMSNVMEQILIPIPPLPVQHELVKIFDRFTEYSLEIKKELKLREEQFRAYSTILFDKCKKESTACLGEVCFVEKGKTPIQKAISGKFPLVVTTSERKTCNEYQFSEPSVCVPLVSSRGHGVASLNHVYYQEGYFALGNILCALTPKNQNVLLAKYLYYYFEQTKDYTLVPLMKGGANVALRIDDIIKVKIPVPSIDQQKKIIAILQEFDELCTNVLPTEVATRQKQYEYYRDKLLTFKPLS